MQTSLYSNVMLDESVEAGSANHDAEGKDEGFRVLFFLLFRRLKDEHF
jgi:hypothetical protein